MQNRVSLHNTPLIIFSTLKVYHLQMSTLPNQLRKIYYMDLGMNSEYIHFLYKNCYKTARKVSYNLCLEQGTPDLICLSLGIRNKACILINYILPGMNFIPIGLYLYMNRLIVSRFTINHTLIYCRQSPQV